MAENKRYYWLKLPQDFFTNKYVKKLRSLPGGDAYTIIVLKILLLGLNDEYHIYYDGLEDTFSKELALTIDEKPEAVELVLRFLLDLGWLVKTDDETYLAEKSKELSGSESASAARVRKHRENAKALQCNTAVTNCNTEIEIEKEKENNTTPLTAREENPEIPVFAQEESTAGSSATFTPPTLSEVVAYFKGNRLLGNPREFLDYYEAVGWMRGNTPIRDWKPLARKWSSKERTIQEERGGSKARNTQNTGFRTGDEATGGSSARGAHRGAAEDSWLDEAEDPVEVMRRLKEEK